MTYNLDFEPLGRRIPCSGGDTIMEVARVAGISLSSICGGRQTCGRCRVRIISGRTPIVGDGERLHLSGDEIAAGFRLACAVRIIDNLKIEIPASSLDQGQRIQLFGEEPAIVSDPVISAHELPLLKSSRNVPPNDLETVLIRYDEIVGVQGQGRPPLGVAFDLGTTTVAAYLVNLRSGETLAAQGMMNPQITHGEDVISRISCALQGGSDELRESVVEALNRLIRRAVADPEEVVEVTVAGNTAMHHLILGLPVKQLGFAPYRPAVWDAVDIKARELGLQAARGAYAHFLPNIGGFVGGDHVAMLLATGIGETERTVIGIDIGTNTEVTLAARGALSSLSCASGPAFEGGGISHGMRAASGAIEMVDINEEGIQLEVIGGVRPIGICGSGMLDLICELRSRQILSPRGVLQDHPLVRQGTRGREFVLVSKESSGTGQDVVVSQHDIEAVQLAKAAVRTGINILMDNAGINEDEIDEFMIAGAFGQHINPRSATDIGLFPPIPLERFRQVGNAAGVGAKLVLISKRERAAAGEIARRVHYIELTTHPQFSRQFSHALRFPNKD